ncbi:MAG TPA: hypothetical protein VN861_05040 [Candidatus Acidoferrales bacterium]|nr:hypothetical protein [Candidatus Acidoferrales bacterium]
MKRTILFAVFLCVNGPLLLAQKSADSAQISGQHVGSAVVWNPSPQILSAIREKCGRDDSSAPNDCFLSEMQSQGASPQAVAFSKAFSEKGTAYVRAFRKVGVVDIAYIEYAFRANELNGVLLVNGEPSIINVDSEGFVSKENFLKDPAYSALAKKYPQISIWPGDRYHASNPQAKHRQSGELSIVVDYILRDGCHACAQIGTATLNFVFDEYGKFSGVQAGSALPNP